MFHKDKHKNKLGLGQLTNKDSPPPPKKKSIKKKKKTTNRPHIKYTGNINE